MDRTNLLGVYGEGVAKNQGSVSRGQYQVWSRHDPILLLYFVGLTYLKASFRSHRFAPLSVVLFCFEVLDFISAMFTLFCLILFPFALFVFPFFALFCVALLLFTLVCTALPRMTLWSIALPCYISWCRWPVVGHILVQFLSAFAPSLCWLGCVLVWVIEQRKTPYLYMCIYRQYASPARLALGSHLLVWQYIVEALYHLHSNSIHIC